MFVFQKWLIFTHYIPGTVLRTENTEFKKIQIMTGAPKVLTFYWGKQTANNKRTHISDGNKCRELIQSDAMPDVRDLSDNEPAMQI